MAIVDEMPETPLHRQLAALRARAGLSQRDLAARMATAQSAVCALEVGRVSPTLTTLTRWAAALGAEIVLRAELTQAEVNAFMDDVMRDLANRARELGWDIEWNWRDKEDDTWSYDLYLWRTETQTGETP